MRPKRFETDGGRRTEDGDALRGQIPHSEKFGHLGHLGHLPPSVLRPPSSVWENTMILLIDNYDSFTYNLFQYLAELGAEVKVVRNDKITLDEIAALAPERIVISPGPGTPEDAGISIDLVR